MGRGTGKLASPGGVSALGRGAGPGGKARSWRVGACAGATRSLPHRHATPGISQVRKVAEQNGVDVSSQIKELEARARQVSSQACSVV